MKISKLSLIFVSLLSLSSCDIFSFSSDKDSSSVSDKDTNNDENQDDRYYYKSLVERDQIKYSADFVNDKTHSLDKLEIFQINDTHGAFYDEDDEAYIYSISRVKTAIEKNTTDKYGCVKIACGDLMQGSSFSNLLLGEPAIASLNEMNFDAFSIGNHEFDWGLDKLAIYKDGDLSNGELECDFLGANILDKNDVRPDWIKPYTVVEKGNVKVGIIGVIGDGLENSISAVALNGYHFSSATAAVEKYSKELRETKGVDIIIVSCHDHSDALNTRFVNNSNVDAIINGHDHWRVEDYIVRTSDYKSIPICESNTKNLTIGKINLYLNKDKSFKVADISHIYVSSYAKDKNLDAIMSVYYKVVSVYQNTVIGYKKGGFSKEEIGISTCNYIAEKYNADIALMNNGGVRAVVSQDDITNSMIFEAFPFDNELYIATVTGEELQKIVGTGYYINDTGIGKGKYLDSTKIDNKKLYKICAVDYVATKIYMTNFFNEEHNLIKTGDYIRDCALENIIENYKKR